MQQPPDMIDVIVDAKTTLHEFGHARTSPQVSVETSGLRTFEQQRFEPTFVLQPSAWMAVLAPAWLVLQPHRVVALPPSNVERCGDPRQRAALLPMATVLP